MTPVAELAAELEAAGIPDGRRAVEAAIAQLAAAHLIETVSDVVVHERPSSPPSHAALSRRAMLKRIGLIAGATLALPIVQSIVAPSVAEACSAQGSACNPQGF